MNRKTALVQLDGLPNRTTRGTIVRLLEQVARLDRRSIGAIELRGRAATIEVPQDQVARLVRTLDGVSLGNHHLRASSEATAPAARASVEDHFAHLRRLLDIEGRAEVEQALARIQRKSGPEAEASGDSLIGMVARDEYAGLGGRTLLTLTKQDRSQPLPWNRLGVGTPVLLSDHRAPSAGWLGVVSERSTAAIQVALGFFPSASDSSTRYRLDVSSDEVARQRQRAALERARIARGDRLAELRATLLGDRVPLFQNAPEWTPLDASLNESQRQAVEFALSAEDVAVLHGPPGTGKTTTVIEVIRQAIRQDQKVLACAPSNLAVDNLLERLLVAGENALRLGHPAHVLPELREHTLDLVVEQHPDVRLANKLLRDSQALRDRAMRYTRAKPAPGRNGKCARRPTACAKTPAAWKTRSCNRSSIGPPSFVRQLRRWTAKSSASGHSTCWSSMKPASRRNPRVGSLCRAVKELCWPVITASSPPPSSRWKRSEKDWA